MTTDKDKVIAEILQQARERSDQATVKLHETIQKQALLQLISKISDLAARAWEDGPCGCGLPPAILHLLYGDDEDLYPHWLKLTPQQRVQVEKMLADLYGGE